MDWLIKKSIEIPSPLPTEFWMDLVKDYGFFADGFVFGKFIMTLISNLGDLNDQMCNTINKTIEINSEWMYPWNFNRLPKEWIVRGFWDQETRKWERENKHNLENQPIDMDKTRRAWVENEQGKSFEKHYADELEQELFIWGRNSENTWQISDESKAHFEWDGTKADFTFDDTNSNKQRLYNNVIEAWIKNIFIIHWVLIDIHTKIKMNKEFNYQSGGHFLDTDFGENLKLLEQVTDLTGWESYLQTIKNDIHPYDTLVNWIDKPDQIIGSTNNEWTDGTWNVFDWTGYWHLAQYMALYLTRKKMIIKILKEINFQDNMYLNFINIFQRIKMYFNVDGWRRIMTEDYFGNPVIHGPLFTISNIDINKDYRIINESNGMFLSPSIKEKTW
jgi:hypothetical protein